MGSKKVSRAQTIKRKFDDLRAVVAKYKAGKKVTFSDHQVS